MDRQQIAVVGHGPSLLDQRRGSEIDSADLVVRMKWHASLRERPDIFGSRTDIAASSLRVAGKLRKLWPDVSRFIVFFDSRTYDMLEAELDAIRAKFDGVELLMDKPLCWTWDELYRQFANPEDEPHTSTGFHVLIHLAKYFPGSDVRLYGFDSMVSGTWTWSLTRGPDWEHYPKHRFDIERRLLGMLGDMCDIRFFDADGTLLEEIK